MGRGERLKAIKSQKRTYPFRIVLLIYEFEVIHYLVSILKTLFPPVSSSHIFIS